MKAALRNGFRKERLTPYACCNDNAGMQMNLASSLLLSLGLDLGALLLGEFI